MANGIIPHKIADEIFAITITGTTGNNGFISVGDNYYYSQGYEVLFATSTNIGNIVVVPSHGAGPNWLYFYEPLENNRPLANTEITATVYLRKH